MIQILVQEVADEVISSYTDIEEVAARTDGLIIPFRTSLVADHKLHISKNKPQKSTLAPFIIHA